MPNIRCITSICEIAYVGFCADLLEDSFLAEICRLPKQIWRDVWASVKLTRSENEHSLGQVNDTIALRGGFIPALLDHKAST